jgi:hypothetical protein
MFAVLAGHTGRVGIMTEPTNQLTLTDAVIRNATVPSGKAQHLSPRR